MASTTLKCILYVEDEPDIQAIARMALEEIGGFTLEICNNGEEALEKVADFKPDLLLLDVMLPGLDGPDTLVQLRQQPGLAKTPAIFLTAKIQPEEMEEYLKLDSVGVIPKPFNPMTLANEIRRLWDTF